MMMLKVFFVAVLVACQVVAKLPDYIKQCSLSDPKFSECFANNANRALPHLLKGVEELQIPPVYTFKPGTLDLDANENLHFHSENGATENSKYKVLDASYNPKTKLLKFLLRTGHSEWTIDFVANGTILEKPILEIGNAKMILDNADVHYAAQLVSKEIGGINHYHIEKYLKSDTTIEKFEFETIDQESVNEPMTDEQRKVWDESLPQLEAAMAAKIDQLAGPLITHVLNVIFKLAPENEIFLA